MVTKTVKVNRDIRAEQLAAANAFRQQNGAAGHACGAADFLARFGQDDAAGKDGPAVGQRTRRSACWSATWKPIATPSDWRRSRRRCKSPPAARATWRFRSWSGRSKSSSSGPLDFLFIEDVGNLICPASHDLGEHLRVLLLSTTEGDDKPGKYPKAFRTSDVLVLSKVGFAAARAVFAAGCRAGCAARAAGVEGVYTVGADGRRRGRVVRVFAARAAVRYSQAVKGNQRRPCRDTIGCQ